MADKTNISWTDSTFNPWWGCTKVAPGCDHCYAEVLDHRLGGNHWGPGTTPRTMADANWMKPLRWQRQAEADGLPRKVFCGSMCDWASNDAPEGQRDRLWQLIRDTPMLTWQLLTKRAPNIVKCLPDDWGDGWPHVWLGVTVEDRKNGLPRIDHLRKVPAAVRFLSVEPLLEDLDIFNLDGIDWVIVGGESGPKARPMHRGWVYNVWLSCIFSDVPFFFKQWGGRKDKGGSLLADRIEVKQWPHRFNDGGLTRD